jgi:DNA-directed RNA polymerase specialized sigma24 family protein
MRWYRESDPDQWEDQGPPPRDERLRELVDQLPRRQQHLVSRVFFGGAHLTEAAAEIKMKPLVAGRLLERALEGLRRALQEED